MAGRSIGSIEVTVDADTGKMAFKLNAETKAIGRQMGKNIDDGLAEVDGRELLTRLKKINQQAQATFAAIEVDFDVDDAGVKADLKRLEAQLRDMAVNLKVSADFDDAEIQAQIAELRRKLNITVEPDFELNRADVDQLKVEAEMLMRGITANVNVEVDDTDVAAEKAKLQAAFADAGDESGSSFLDAFSGRMQLIAALVAGFAEPAATALVGALGEGIQLLGSAFSGLAGGAGAALPIMLSMAGAFTAVFVGSQGMVDTLKAMNKEFSASVAEGRDFNINAEEITEQLRNLAPAAQAFAVELADTLPILREIRTETQDRLFVGLDRRLNELSKTLLPEVGEALGTAADSLNKFFKGLADVGTGIDLGDLFKSMQPAIDNLLDAVLEIIKAIQPFFKAAVPAAEALSEMFQRGATHLGEMIRSGEESGALTKFLSDGIDSLKSWIDLAGSVGKVLFTLFEAGKEGGDTLIDSLTQIVDKFNGWLKSVAGQKALDSFFKSSIQIMESLVPILQGLTELFEGMISTGSIERFDGLAQAVGDLLPVIGELLTLIGEADVFSTLIQAAVELAQVMQPLMPILHAVAEAIGAIPPEVVAGVLALLGIVKAFDLAKDAFGGFMKFATAAITANVTTVWLYGIATAIGVVVTALSFLSSGNEKANARIKEVSDSLGGQVDQLLQDANAANEAATGVTALSRALAGSGEAGEKLTRSLGVIHKSVDDTVDIFAKLSKDPVDALEELARGAGLSEDAAKALAIAVNDTDEDFDEFAKGLKRGLEGNAAETQLIDLADRFHELGLTTEDITPDFIAVGKALEEIQDQSDIDLGKTVFEFLNTSAASSELNEKLLEQAEAATVLRTSSESLVPLFEEYTRLLAENKVQSDADALAQAQVNEMLRQQGVAADAAFDPLTSVNLALSETAKQADAASAAADALKASFDLLISPAVNFQAAQDSLQDSVAKLNEQILGAKTGAEGFSTSLDGSSEASRANRDAIRDQIGEMLNYSTNALEVGQSSDQVTGALTLMREGLIQQVEQFGLSREAAEEYVDQLGLTPDNIKTIVEQPGMDAATTDTKDYKKDLDKIDKEVATDVKAPALPDHIANAEEYQQKLRNLPATTTTAITAPGAAVSKTQAEDLKEALDDVPKTVTTQITQIGLTAAKSDAQTYQSSLEDIPNSITTTFHVAASSAHAALDELKRKVDALNGRTITINSKVTGVPGFAQGGIVGSMGGIGGEAGPEWVSWAGRNALINQPTFLPPGTVVTPVSQNQPGSIGTTVNNYVTVNTVVQDPVAVATQVTNRIAQMVS